MSWGSELQAQLKGFVPRVDVHVVSRSGNEAKSHGFWFWDEKASCHFRKFPSEIARDLGGQDAAATYIDGLRTIRLNENGGIDRLRS
jgi:hypothetical protein